MNDENLDIVFSKELCWSTSNTVTVLNLGI